MDRQVMRVAALAVLTLGAFHLSAAKLGIGYVYPASVQVGTTNRLIVGGQNFWGLMEAGVTGGGVEVTRVERMALSAPPSNSQRIWLRTWLDAIIEKGERKRPPYPTNATARVNEWTANAWWQTLDQLGRRELEAVERDIYIRKNPLQMSPALREILFVDVVVASDAAPGRRAFTVWSPNAIAAPHPLIVTAAPHLEEPYYAPPHRASPPPSVVRALPCVLDGRILPGETDRFTLSLTRGQRLACTVTARELQPFVGDAVPGFFNPAVRLVGTNGVEVAFADDRARFCPDPAFTAEIPADGLYTLEIHDVLYRGREDFVYSIALAEAPAKPPAPRTALARTETRWYAPWTWGRPRLAVEESVDGVIAPGVPNVYDVTLEGPGTFVFDLAARRKGSALDGVLTLADADGTVIWRQDDVTNVLLVGSVAQAECDARGQVTLASGERRALTVTVEDLTGHGGADYFYTLSLARARPAFAAYASHSAFLARRGVRQPFTLHIARTGGFDGPVVLVPGADYHFEGGYVPAGSNEAHVAFLSMRNDEAPLRAVTLRALGEVDGRPVVVDVVPADTAMQAFAWTHLVPAETFLVKALLPSPPRLSNPLGQPKLVLAGPGVTADFAADVRRLLALRRPHAAPDVETAAEVPDVPPALPPHQRHTLLVTPLPIDIYSEPRAPDVLRAAEARAAVAEKLRRLAARRGVALLDLHYLLKPILRERPYLRLLGADGCTPTPEMRLILLGFFADQLGWDAGEIATVRLRADRGRETGTKGRVRKLALTRTGGTFVYAARALPWPDSPAYRTVDAFYPLTRRINREMLHVTDLAPGRYTLVMDDRTVGTFTAAEFARGINLARLDTPGQRRAEEAFARGELPKPEAVRVALRPVPPPQTKKAKN